MGDPNSAARRIGDVGAVAAAFDALPLLACATEGPEHRFIAANAAYERFLGRDVLLGRPIRDVVPEIAGQQIHEVLDEAYRCGDPLSYREWRLQLDRTGTGELEEAYLDFDVTPLRSLDGTVFGLVATAVDVTERVRERARALAATEHLQAALEIVTGMQRALLPAGLPVLPQAWLAARYLVAGEEQVAGGDWFDALPRPDGTLAVVVGDIVGHGVTATAAMGQLRAVLGELLTCDLPLERVLSRADALVARTPTMRASTACVAVLSRDGALHYATCGHPAPLLVPAEEPPCYLPASGAGPLGTGASLAVASASLPAGATLLLYSDGLIERPGRSLAEGQATLAQVAADARSGRALPMGASTAAAERICDLCVELLTRTGHADDVTALAVERLSARVEPLHLDLRSDADELRRVRRLLADWLAPLAVEPRAAQALQLAVSELVANSVEHGYRDGQPGQVCVDVALHSDSTATLCVADKGRWQEPAGPMPSRGRGLWLVAAMVDELRVEHPDGPEHGTVVTVRHALRRPVQLAAEPAGAPERPAAPAAFAVVNDVSESDEAGGLSARVLVRGPVDLATASRFADQLRSASRGGLHALTVDLSEVTLLGSVGVRVLYELRDALAVHRQRLTLVAPPGTPAHAVLDVVALPHSSGDRASVEAAGVR